MYTTVHQEQENALLIGIIKQNEDRWIAEEHLNELELLADTAGANVLDKIIQERHKVDPATFIGRGKIDQIRDLVDQQDISLIIFDEDLTPAQVRNLENFFEIKVIDRTVLILDIFAKRAKTREAKTQVELAQLKYLLPRLTRQWTHLSRQVGGIGTKGPGETQLEVDRRLIRLRIRALTHHLQKIQKRRSIHRSHRKNIFKVALVGYTNVGKSTLLNALTDSNVFVEDRLFATLDPTIKALDFTDKNRVLLIDTVGFIRKLPHHLIASFRSTLEEAAEADLLLHLVDISHPHFENQMEIVREVLKELNMDTKTTIHVFNKVDLLNGATIISRLREQYPDSVFISALRGVFLEDLKKRILEFLEGKMIETDVILDVKNSKLISKIYSLAEVLETNYTDSKVNLRIRAEQKHFDQIRYLIEK